MSKFTLVINAGGNSRRMGQNKALLPVPSSDGGTRPLIAHIAERLRHLSPERIVVVANDEMIVKDSQIARPVEFVPDSYPGMGALGGIATGLEVVDEWAIMVACDMPLVSADVFGYLCKLAAATHTDVVVPIVDGYEQTHYALYHRRCLPAIGKRLAAAEKKVTRFFSDVAVRKVTEDEICPLDPDLRSFLNANTPDEWARALRMLDS